MASGLLSLKWNNHKSTFFHILSTIRSKESYCDATLACDGRFYPVHKLILSTCSEYFEEMFQRTQCKHPVIVLKDIRFEELDALLNYMYLGEVNVLQDKLAGLIKAAECLKIKGLAVPDEAPLGFRESKRGSSRESGSPHPKRRRREFNKLREINSPEGRNDSEPSAANSESSSSRTKVSETPSDDVEKSEEYESRELRDERNRDSSRKPVAEIILDEMGVKNEPPDIVETLEEIADTKEELHSELNFEEEVRQRVGGEDFTEDSAQSNSAMAEGYTEDSYPEWDGDGSLQEYPPEGYSGENSDGTPMVQSNKNFKDGRRFSHQFLQDEPDFLHPQPSKMSAKNADFSHSLALNSVINSGSNSVSGSGWMGTGNVNSIPIPHQQSIRNLYGSSSAHHNTLHIFRCTECTYVTTRKQDLMYHFRTHTGEKPFECPFCHHRFTVSSNLKAHLKRKHMGDQSNL